MHLRMGTMFVQLLMPCVHGHLAILRLQNLSPPCDCEAFELVGTLRAVRGVDVCLRTVLNYLLRRGITRKKVHDIYMLYYKCGNIQMDVGGRVVGRSGEA